MEQVTGIEPASPAWKAGALTIVLHLHIKEIRPETNFHLAVDVLSTDAVKLLRFGVTLPVLEPRRLIDFKEVN